MSTHGPEIATISIHRIPFDDGYSFEIEHAGVSLEDHPLAPAMPLYGLERIYNGLVEIGLVLDEIEQAGP